MLGKTEDIFRNISAVILCAALFKHIGTVVHFRASENGRLPAGTKRSPPWFHTTISCPHPSRSHWLQPGAASSSHFFHGGNLDLRSERSWSLRGIASSCESVVKIWSCFKQRTSRSQVQAREAGRATNHQDDMKLLLYIYIIYIAYNYKYNMRNISWHFMSSGIAHDYSCNFILWWPLLEQTNKAGRLRNGSSQPPRPLREDSVSQWTLDFDQDRMIMDDGCSTCFLVSTFSILFYTSNGHI